jgi:hypothetical protein
VDTDNNKQGHVTEKLMADAEDRKIADYYVNTFYVCPAWPSG